MPSVANVVMQTLWACAFYYINPAFMVLLTKSSIIWVAALSMMLFPEERSLLKSVRFWAGLGLCAVGVVGVVASRPDFSAEGTLLGIVLCLICALAWAAYTVTAKLAFKDMQVGIGFGVVTIYTTLGLGVLALLFGEPGKALDMPLSGWGYAVGSGVLCLGVNHALYYLAIKRIGATIPQLLLLVTPLTVLGLSSLIFGESMSGGQWGFGAALVAGAALSVLAQRDLHKA